MLSVQPSPTEHVFSTTSSACHTNFPGEFALGEAVIFVEQAPCLADSSTEAHEHQEKPEEHGFGVSNVDKRQKRLLEPRHVETSEMMR